MTVSEIDELKKILKKHGERISKLENALSSPNKPKLKKSNKTSIMDLIIEVKGEGFFDKPKLQKEIVEKFEELGFIYDTKSLSDPLSRALKSRILGRKKIDGRWNYVKR